MKLVELASRTVNEINGHGLEYIASSREQLDTQKKWLRREILISAVKLVISGHSILLHSRSIH